jgi:NAD(P)-dependent dehydrogenase (short-subunit alcohol dehydrogenase family)
VTVDAIGAATARLLVEAGAIRIRRDRPDAALQETRRAEFQAFQQLLGVSSSKLRLFSPS